MFMCAFMCMCIYKYTFTCILTCILTCMCILNLISMFAFVLIFIGVVGACACAGAR